MAGGHLCPRLRNFQLLVQPHLPHDLSVSLDDSGVELALIIMWRTSRQMRREDIRDLLRAGMAVDGDPLEVDSQPYNGWSRHMAECLHTCQCQLGDVAVSQLDSTFAAIHVWPSR